MEEPTTAFTLACGSCCLLLPNLQTPVWGFGGAAYKVTPRQPQHPWREWLLLGPGLLAGPTHQGCVARPAPAPCARKVAQAGTPSPAAVPCLHG